MQLGDILLVKYHFDPLSWLIRLVLRSKYNHVAWCMGCEYLIESSIWGKIRTTPIKKYLNRWLYSVKLVRPRVKHPSVFITGQDYWLDRVGSTDTVHCASLIASGLVKSGMDIKKYYEDYTPKDFENTKLFREVKLNGR